MKCKMMFVDDRMWMDVAGKFYCIYNYDELEGGVVGNVVWRMKKNYESFCRRMRLKYVGI